MKASGPPMMTKRAPGGGHEPRRRLDEIFHPLFAIQPPDPADDRRVGVRAELAPRPGRSAGSNSLRSTMDGISSGVLRAARQRSGSRLADRFADADIAGGQVLGTGGRFGHQPAMLDQGRARAIRSQRGVNIGDRLAGDDQIVSGILPARYATVSSNESV